MGHTGKTSWK